MTDDSYNPAVCCRNWKRWTRTTWGWWQKSRHYVKPVRWHAIGSGSIVTHAWSTSGGSLPPWALRRFRQPWLSAPVAPILPPPLHARTRIYLRNPPALLLLLLLLLPVEFLQWREPLKTVQQVLTRSDNNSLWWPRRQGKQYKGWKESHRREI